MWNLENETKPNPDLQRIDWWLPEVRVVAVGVKWEKGRKEVQTSSYKIKK